MKKSIFLKTFGAMLMVGTTLTVIEMVACKSSSTTPTKTPTASSITVSSSSDLLYVGVSETFTATVTMSDGTTKAVTGGAWRTDATNVATVESSTGKVTGVGSGNVDIIVDYQGKEGVKRIRVLPNYQGTWSGSYYITGCSDSSQLRGSCNSFPINHVFPDNFNLIQTRDTVTGKFYLGELSASASGPIQTDGQLLLTGTIVSGIWSIDVSWRMASATPGNITGSLNMIWLAAGYSGDMRISANIRDLNRTSNIMMMNLRAPQMSYPTIQSLVRALMGR